MVWGYAKISLIFGSVLTKSKPTKSQLIGIPTTSGTGSEVTPFAVITDSKTHVKYPLADYALTPNIAIVDSQFVETVPAKTTAWTGLDVLCHATESYVSVMATDYTRGWSLQTIEGVMENLPKSVQGDKLARRKMHDFSTMAGMAFGQAFLGSNHSLAHKMGWSIRSSSRFAYRYCNATSNSL